MIVLDGFDEAPKKTIKELFVLLEDLADLSRFGTRFSWAIFQQTGTGRIPRTQIQQSNGKG
jgi:hypothetical protein